MLNKQTLLPLRDRIRAMHDAYEKEIRKLDSGWYESETERLEAEIAALQDKLDKVQDRRDKIDAEVQNGCPTRQRLTAELAVASLLCGEWEMPVKSARRTRRPDKLTKYGTKVAAHKMVREVFAKFECDIPWTEVVQYLSLVFAPNTEANEKLRAEFATQLVRKYGPRGTHTNWEERVREEASKARRLTPRPTREAVDKIREEQEKAKQLDGGAEKGGE